MIASPTSGHVTRLYRVCWTSVVDDTQTQGHGRPMARDLAEFIAHDEELGHPMRRYWVEACPDSTEDDE